MAFARTQRQALDLGSAVGPQLYRILRERIIRNDLEAGARISESEIASDYAVSRQPVREAFIKLADEGLVEVRPQRGTFVRKIAPSAVMGARFVREAIEADIAKYLAANPVANLVDDLRRQLREQGKFAGRDPVHFIELDERFHRTLAEAAGQSYAWNIIEGVKAQMDRVRHLSARRFPMEKLVEQHTAIVDSIAACDAAAAEAAVRGHLRELLLDLPAIADSRPEYFEDEGYLPATIANERRKLC